MDTFAAEYRDAKQTAKDSGDFRELGDPDPDSSSATQADNDKAFGEDGYETLARAPGGSMRAAASAMKSDGVLGSAGGLLSPTSGVYQFAGQGGTLADTPEERLSIAGDFVGVLGSVPHFGDLGPNIIDRVNGAKLNRMTGLGEPLPEIHGTDHAPQGTAMTPEPRARRCSGRSADGLRRSRCVKSLWSVVLPRVRCWGPF